MLKLNDKLYSWATIIDPNAEEQAHRASKMPFVHPHLALMPDAHFGKGATVGSVIPTKGAIIPAAVGVDIGCGMIAVRTQYTKQDLEGKDLSEIRKSIERSIPLSAGNSNNKLTETAGRRAEELRELAGERDSFYGKLTRTHYSYQLGSLGSGNHFIEVTLDELDRVWLFLHSGSRGIGNRIAQHHIEKAQKLAKKYFIPLEDPDLAYLVEGTPEFDDYMTDLKWAQHFAYLNREEMMDRVVRDFGYFMGGEGEAAVELEEIINCHHNFTTREHHMGQDLLISRKGAIKANVGDMGLIPGSMGTASYVVEGKGNVMSFHSSPHGAGRIYGRNAAKKQFTLEDMDAQMGDIEYRRSEAFLDEIPSAYKDIDQVMQDAADLVEIKHTLHQIVNVKGD